MHVPGPHLLQQIPGEGRVQRQQGADEIGGHQAAPAETLGKGPGMAAHAPFHPEQGIRQLAVGIGVAEQALEANNFHILEAPQQEAVVALHHMILGVGGEDAQAVEGALAVDDHIFAQGVQGVAGGQHQPAAVHIALQLRLIGGQGLDHQPQAPLGGRTHVHQVHAAVQKGGAVLQTGFHHLHLRAGLAQIGDVHQVAAEVGHLGEQNLGFHACTSCSAARERAISFIWSYT